MSGTFPTTFSPSSELTTPPFPRNGPSEFTITGSLKTWSIIDRLPLIDAQVLIINGSYDEAQDSCVAPYFEHIRKVKWITVEGASHFTHVERRGRYMQVVGDFLG